MADRLLGLSKTSILSIPSPRVFNASLLAVLVGFGIYLDYAASDNVPEQAAAALEGQLAHDFASPGVRRVAQWAVSTQDHAGMPFVVIDRSDARIYAFDPQGRLRGSAPWGLASDGAFAAAPAGRFVANTLASARGGGIVWQNDQSAFTLHAVPSQQLGEAPPHVQDRSDALLLHVEALFYRNLLEVLRTQPSIAYVLPPDGTALDQVFGMGAARAEAADLRSERARSAYE